MATYGKKKRAAFPGFSVFQDDDQPPRQAQAYTQLGKPEPDARHGDLYSTAKDDEDIDELANPSLLDSLDTDTSTTGTSMRSGLQQPQEALKAPRKPLPPLPAKGRPKLDRSNANKQVLGPKSSNMKVVSTLSKVHTKAQISPPILISSSRADPFGLSAAPNQAQLDKKMAELQQQADAQAAETREKEKRLAAFETSARPSPLQRGKSMLRTAKHAIATRLSSPKIKLGRPGNPLSRTLSGPEYASIGKQSNMFSNSGRPLPVYESMRTRTGTPEHQEDPDPFSDSMETNEVWSDFEFDFDQHKGKSPSNFSNQISGLRQHPDADFFSSSPVGFSTPRVRLAPTSDANGKKRLSAVLVRDPSALDFSSEQETTDDEHDPLIDSVSEAELGSSMKRKSATEDLRFQASKRAKTDSGTSGESTVLAQGFGQLGTGDVQAMQGIEAVADDTAVKEKGFGIFDMGKGKEPEGRLVGFTDSSSMRRHSRQQSSSASRPSSVLFSRESRARVPLLKSFRDDEMEVDELHTG
ncbi:MAG: hypothetical protein LQ345_007043 [Seirophora villosa]|nr:MAG: hypothetical protein LQ345_007043 [Seirophora villosa]